MTLIEKARSFAREAHKGQKDDCGEDYFEAHLIPVASVLMKVTDDPRIIAAGFLHDTVEDTDITEEELRKYFGDHITDLVMEVTHEGQKDNYGHWFPRLETRDGIMLKFADRLSNMSRMDSWSESRKAQYLRKSKFWKSEGPQ